MNEPIIQSRLDTDYYKFTMSRFWWQYYQYVQVSFSLINRSSEPLATLIPSSALIEQLNHFQALSLTDDELAYLGSRMLSSGEPVFPAPYLDYLRSTPIPPIQVTQVGNQYQLTSTGPAPIVTFWETAMLSIVNELAMKGIAQREGMNETVTVREENRRLLEKFSLLDAWDDIRYVEFGTRRRRSRATQYRVLERSKERVRSEQLLGTSNVWMAKCLDLAPKGTMAHELFMVLAALWSWDAKALREVQNAVLDLWWQLYGQDLSIALIDTFGSPFSFKTMPHDIASKWLGFRLDSGDLKEMGEGAIAFWLRNGVNPKQKMLFPSDALTLPLARDYLDDFGHRAMTSFGIGTYWTNDCGLPTLPIVAKASAANGQPTVKLSDNLAKASGPPEQVEFYKSAFGYTNTHSEPCRY